MKVYLQTDDKESRRFCESHVKNKPKYSRLEFVVVGRDSRSKKTKDIREEELRISKISIELKRRIKGILKSKRDELYAKHSNLVAMGMSPVMYSDGRVHRKPCIAFYCLDADLVPFGEKPLPSVLSDSSGDIPCDVREDYIQLGYCRNCRGLQNGCSVGQYGVQLSGSIGFFVRRKYSSHTPQLPYDGFLTAAHVALEDDILKKMKGTKFKNCYHGLHLIVHPSLEDSGTNNVIGEVEDSFFGNHEEVGIDAAFVKTYKNEGNVDPDMEYEVIGHGRTSGTTTGILKETFMSFRKSFPERAGIYLVLDNCFTIYRIRIEPKEFFEPGDSGSAVYVVEADNTQHPLGLAFGVLGEHKITFASPVKKITDILNLSVVQPAQPMNIP